ncbi:hypothetical protein MTR67_001991, partial [Solanum verrucosum]
KGFSGGKEWYLEESEGLVEENHLMISQSLMLYKNQRKIIPQMKSLADLTKSTKSSSVAESELRQSTEKGHVHELFSQGSWIRSCGYRREEAVQVLEVCRYLLQEASGQFCFHATHFYGLKEHVLATCLINALSMSGDSDDVHYLLNWRKGNFSLVATEVNSSSPLEFSDDVEITQ